MAELAICTTPQRPSCPEALTRPGEQEFTFSRLIFADNQRAIESEPHFISALQRLTHLDTNTDSQSISLLDDRIFDYPMLYVVEAGFA